MKRESKKLRALKKAAGRSTNVFCHIAASKVTPKDLAGWKKRKLGKFGPASEVRHIDPLAYKLKE